MNYSKYSRSIINRILLTGIISILIATAVCGSQYAGNTIMKFHFDSLANKKVHCYGKPEIVPGIRDKAIAFDGKSAVYIDWNYNLNRGFVVSLWFWATPKQNNPYPRILELPGRLMVNLNSASGHIFFSLIGTGHPKAIKSYSKHLNDASWHHLLIIFNTANRKYSLFIDDKPEGEAKLKKSSAINIRSPRKPGDNYLWLASANMKRNQARCLIGKLDDLKISKKER